MNDVLNRHDKMQRLNRSTTYIYPGKKKQCFCNAHSAGGRHLYRSGADGYTQSL